MISRTHHASEREERRLDLCHVAMLKQVVGFEDVMRLQAICPDGFDEVRQVLQLKPHQFRATLRKHFRYRSHAFLLAVSKCVNCDWFL